MHLVEIFGTAIVLQTYDIEHSSTWRAYTNSKPMLRKLTNQFEDFVEKIKICGPEIQTAYYVDFGVCHRKVALHCMKTFRDMYYRRDVDMPWHTPCVGASQDWVESVGDWESYSKKWFEHTIASTPNEEFLRDLVSNLPFVNRFQDLEAVVGWLKVCPLQPDRLRWSLIAS